MKIPGLPCIPVFSKTNVLIPVLLLATVLAAPAQAARKIILDTDPGTDDALALMLALNSPELDVRAITVVPGNVTAAMGLDNALRMVSLASRCDIPVAAGAQHPLFHKLITAEFWHGKNGLANVELPPSKCTVDARFGPDLIIELVHASPHQITLVPVGPLTNIALAVEKDPSIVPLVKEVILWAARSVAATSMPPLRPTSITIPKLRKSSFRQAGRSPWWDSKWAIRPCSRPGISTNSARPTGP